MDKSTTPVQSHAPRLAWQTPEVKDLPRLTELTLATGSSIPGDCGLGGSGSTCY